MTKKLDLDDDLFNPEAFTQEEIKEEKNEANMETAKCPSCGANLIYEPETRGLKCPYCGTEERLTMDNYCTEQEIDKLFSPIGRTWDKETKVFRCENCGANTVISSSELSKECAFCGTSNIVEAKEMSGLRPDAVLPFIITKDIAKDKLIVWAKKKFFAPRKFKKSVKPESLYGNYSPSFTFDSETINDYKGTLGKYYYTTRIVNGKTQRVRHIRYYNISGTHRTSFDDILVQASDNIPPKILGKLQPFDTNSAQEYSPDYLFGFSATQYNRDGKECWRDAQRIMYDNVKKQILSKYDYDVVSSLNVNMNCYDVKYKYVLLPLYVGHYRFQKKIYNFYVNGRNGKVAGKTPISPLKVGFTILGILAFIAFIIYLYLANGGN